MDNQKEADSSLDFLYRELKDLFGALTVMDDSTAMIVLSKALETEGYRKADDVRKEVATELFELVYQFCKENFQSEFLGWGPELSAAAKAKNAAMNELYRRMKVAVEKYGVEVEDK